MNEFVTYGFKPVELSSKGIKLETTVVDSLEKAKEIRASDGYLVNSSSLDEAENEIVRILAELYRDVPVYFF